MRTISLNLWWKQWRENKNYLVGFTVAMLIGSAYVIAYERAHPFATPVGRFSSVALFYSLFAAVTLAVRATRGEQDEGTHAFTESLPISLRRVAATRILAACITLALPVLLAAVLISGALAGGYLDQALPRDAQHAVAVAQRSTAPLHVALEQLWSVTAIALLGGIELLLVTSAIGCGLRSGAQIGLLGSVTALGSVILAGLFWFDHRNPSLQRLYGVVMPQSLIAQWGYGSEKGHFVDHEIVPGHWTSLAFSLVVLMLWGWIFVWRYGTASERTRAKRQALPHHPPIRRRSQLSAWIVGPRSALLWSELRQAVPLAGYGFLLALVLAFASVLMEPSAGESVLMSLPHSVWAVGTLWAVVVGSSLYGTELSSGLDAFRRSRPIHPSIWFWCKFLVGLAAVLLVLDGLTAVVSWNPSKLSTAQGMSWSYLACVPLMHAFLYSLGVLGTCWIRRPVFGGLVAVAGYALLNVALGISEASSAVDPLNVYNHMSLAERRGSLEFIRPGYPVVYGTLLLLTLLIGALASRFANPKTGSLRRARLGSRGLGIKM